MEQDDSQSQKKDLTNLNDFTTSEPGASEPAVSISGLTEETPIEKVEAFESLDTLTTQGGSLTEENFEPKVFDTEPVVHLDFNPLDQPSSQILEKGPDLSPILDQPPASASDVLDHVKKFSENLAPTAPVAAAFPFSLLIEGRLKPDEQEKLLDLISKEKIGIRAMDLELQLQKGKILIPRISEYAGIMIVQALRGVSAEMKLAPSDQIFSTADTRSEVTVEKESHTLSSIAGASPFEHPAENIPVTSERQLPGTMAGIMIDTVTASAMLKSTTVEMETSAEYLEILENLKRELKYKAYHRGGTAVVGFSVTLSPLSIPTHYRITAMGTAVKLDRTQSAQELGGELTTTSEWEPVV